MHSQTHFPGPDIFTIAESESEDGNMRREISSPLFNSELQRPRGKVLLIKLHSAAHRRKLHEDGKSASTSFLSGRDFFYCQLHAHKTKKSRKISFPEHDARNYHHCRAAGSIEKARGAHSLFGFSSRRFCIYSNYKRSEALKM